MFCATHGGSYVLKDFSSIDSFDSKSISPREDGHDENFARLREWTNVEGLRSWPYTLFTSMEGIRVDRVQRIDGHGRGFDGTVVHFPLLSSSLDNLEHGFLSKVF